MPVTAAPENYFQEANPAYKEAAGFAPARLAVTGTNVLKFLVVKAALGVIPMFS